MSYFKEIRIFNLIERSTIIMEFTGIYVPLLYEPPRTSDVGDSPSDISKAEEQPGMHRII